MNSLSPGEQKLWDQYCDSLPLRDRPVAPLVEASMPGNSEIANSLVQLYLDGHKTAGSSLLADFIAAGDQLPSIGKFWIVLDSTGEARCIVRTDRVDQTKFKEVGLEVAIAEGEGDLSLAYWRQAHADFFQPFLQSWGVTDLEEAIVITEFFSVVYK
jgi:uncharacterized protein YhfF